MSDAYVKEYQVFVLDDKIVLASIMSDDCLCLHRWWFIRNFTECKLNSYLKKVRLRDNARKAKVIFSENYKYMRSKYNF